MTSAGRAEAGPAGGLDGGQHGPDVVTGGVLDRLVGGQALRDGITGGGWNAILELLELFAKPATNEA